MNIKDPNQITNLNTIKNPNVIKNPMTIYNPRNIQNPRIIHNPSIITPNYWDNITKQFRYNRYNRYNQAAWDAYKNAQKEDKVEDSKYANHEDTKEINSLLDLITYAKYGASSGFKVNSKHGAFGEYFYNVWQKGMNKSDGWGAVWGTALNVIGAAGEDVDVIANLFKAPLIKTYQAVTENNLNLTEDMFSAVMNNHIADIAYNFMGLVTSLIMAPNPTARNSWGYYTDYYRKLYGYREIPGISPEKQKDYIPYHLGVPGEGRENYTWDTGNFFADFVLEVVTDPTNMVENVLSGGIKSATNSVVKNSTKNFVETMGRFGIKMTDDVAEDILKTSVKAYTYGGMDAVNSKIAVKLKKAINKGTIDITGCKYTIEAISKNIIEGKFIDNTSILAKSLKGVDGAVSMLKKVETVDKTLLKFAFTQGTYPVLSVAHKYVGSPLFTAARYFAFDKLYKPFVKKADTMVDIFKLDELEATITKAYDDDKLIQSLTNDYGSIINLKETLIQKSVAQDLFDVKKALMDFTKDFFKNKGVDYNPDDVIKIINETLSNKYGRPLTLEEYIEYLQNINKMDNLKHALNDNISDFLKFYDEVNTSKVHFGKYIDSVRATEVVTNVTKATDLSKAFNAKIKENIIRPFRKMYTDIKNTQYKRVGAAGLKHIEEFNKILEDIRKVLKQDTFAKDPEAEALLNVLNNLKPFNIKKGADTNILSQYVYIRNALVDIQNSNVIKLNNPLLKNKINNLLQILDRPEVFIDTSKVFDYPVTLTKMFDDVDAAYKQYRTDIMNIRNNIISTAQKHNVNKVLIENTIKIIDDYLEQSEIIYEELFEILSELPKSFTLEYVGRFDIKKLNNKIINFKETMKQLESIKAITKDYATYDTLFKDVDIRQASDSIFSTIRQWLSKNNNEADIVNTIIKDFQKIKVIKSFEDTNVIDEDSLKSTLKEILTEDISETDFEDILHDNYYDDFFQEYLKENSDDVSKLNAIEYGFKKERFDELWNEFTEYIEEELKTIDPDVDLIDSEIERIAEKIKEQALLTIHPYVKPLVEDKMLTFKTGDVYFSFKMEQLQTNLKLMTDEKLHEMFTAMFNKVQGSDIKISNTQFNDLLDTVDSALANTKLSETEAVALKEVSDLLKRIIGAAANYNNYANFLDDLSKIVGDASNPELTIFPVLDVLQKKSFADVDKILENPKAFLEEVIKDAEAQINSIYKIDKSLKVSELLKPYGLTEEHTALSDAVQEAFLAKKELGPILQKKYGDCPVYFLDIEATGSNAIKDSIVDIGFIKMSDVDDVIVDGKVVYKNGQQFTAKLPGKSIYHKMPKNSVLKNIISDSEVEAYKTNTDKLAEVEQFAQMRYSKKYLRRLRGKDFTTYQPVLKKDKLYNKSLEDLTKEGYDVSAYKNSLSTDLRNKSNASLYVSRSIIKEFTSNTNRVVDDNIIRQYVYYKRYFTKTAEEAKLDFLKQVPEGTKDVDSEFLKYYSENIEKDIKYENQIISDFLKYVSENVEENAVIIGHNAEEFDFNFIKTRFLKNSNTPEDLAIATKQSQAYVIAQKQFNYFENLAKDDTYKIYKKQAGALSYDVVMKDKIQKSLETYLYRIKETSNTYKTPNVLINPVPRHIISDASNLLNTLDTIKTTIALPKLINTKDYLNDLISATARAFSEISVSNKKLGEVLINRDTILNGNISDNLKNLLQSYGVDPDNLKNISQVIYRADAPDTVKTYGYVNAVDFDLINDYFTLKSLDENGEVVIRSYQDGDMISEKSAIAMTKKAKSIKRTNEEASKFFQNTGAIKQETLHKFYVESYDYLTDALYTVDETGKPLMYKLTTEVTESLELIKRLNYSLQLKGDSASFGVVFETYRTIKEILGESFDEFIKSKNNSSYNTLNQLFSQWDDYNKYSVDLNVLTGNAAYPVKNIDDVLADTADYDYFIHTLQNAVDSLDKAARVGDVLDITSNRRLFEVRKLKNVQDIAKHIREMFDNITDDKFKSVEHIDELNKQISIIKNKIDNAQNQLKQLQNKKVNATHIDEELNEIYNKIDVLYKKLKETTDKSVKKSIKKQIENLNNKKDTLKKSRKSLSAIQKQQTENIEVLKSDIESYKQDLKNIKKDYSTFLQTKATVVNSYRTVTDRFAINQTAQILRLNPEQLYRFMVYNAPIISCKNVENNLALAQLYKKVQEIPLEEFEKNGITPIITEDGIYFKLKDFSGITYSYNKATRSVDAFTPGGNLIKKVNIIDPHADYEDFVNNTIIDKNMFKGILNTAGEEDEILQELLIKATSKLYESSNAAARGTLLDTVDSNTYINFIEALPDEVKAGFDIEQFRHSTFFAQKLYNNFNLGDVVSRKSLNEYYSSSFIQNLINSTVFESSARSTACDYIDLFNDGDLKLKNMAIKDNPKDLPKTLKDNGYKLVLYVENKKGHMYVKDITPNTPAAAKIALSNETVLNNAIVVPYNIYSSMVEQLEYNIYNMSFLKYLRPIIWQYKVWSLIGKIRTPIVNYIDSTIKEVSDTGSIYETFKNQARAVKDIREYSKIMKGITGLDAVNIKALEDSGVDVSEFLTSLVNKRKDAKKLVELYNEAYMDLSKNIDLLDTLNKKTGYVLKDSIKEVIKQPHTLRFTTDNIDFYFKHMNTKITKEEFYTLHEFFTDGPSGGMLKDWQEYYNSFSKTADKKTIYSHYVNFLNFMMKPNTDVERVIRLSEYLALLDQGYTTTNAFSKISKTHFDYALSNNTLRAVELVKPFTTFRIKNLMYWVSVFNENPRMLLYLTDFYNNNWELDNINPQYEATNLALKYVAESGAINTGVQYESENEYGNKITKGLYIKASPSVFDALSMLSKPLDTYGLLPPIREGIKLLETVLADVPEHLIDRYLIENPGTNRLAAKKYIRNAVNSGFTDTTTFEELTYIYQTQHKGIGYLRAKQNIYDEACGGDYSKLKDRNTIKIPKGLLEVYGKRYSMLEKSQLEYAIKSAIQYSYENNIYSKFKKQTSVLEDILAFTPIGGTVNSYIKGIENFKETGNPLLFFSDMFGLYKQAVEKNKTQPIKTSNNANKYYRKYLYREPKKAYNKKSYYKKSYNRKTYPKKTYPKKTYAKKYYNKYDYDYNYRQYHSNYKADYSNQRVNYKPYYKHLYNRTPRRVYLYEKYYTKKGKNRWQSMTQSKPTTKQGLKYKLIQWQHYTR